MVDKALFHQIHAWDFSQNDRYCEHKEFKAWSFIQQLKRAQGKPIITGRMEEALQWYFPSSGHYQIHMTYVQTLLFCSLKTAGYSTEKARAFFFTSLLMLRVSMG
jgi:hypothetical protein